MRLTPFHERTAPLNRQQLWFNWDRHIVPNVYDDLLRELRAMRDGVSIDDKSPLSKYAIIGREASRFIDLLVTAPTQGLEVGESVYTPWCDGRGKVVGDGLVLRQERNRYLITSDPQFLWFSQHLEGLDCSVEDLSDDYGILALEGPGTLDVLAALTAGEWSDLPYSRARQIQVDGAEIEVIHRGVTGTLGYQLIVPAEAALTLWDAIAAVGEPFGLTPVGENAIDITRVEQGIVIVGADYTGVGPDRCGSVVDTNSDNYASPVELGFGPFVHLEKTVEFNGKSALVAEAAAGGPPRRLVGLDIEWRPLVEETPQDRVSLIPSRVSWYPLSLMCEGESVGRATSVTWSPSLGALIGFGHVPNELAVKDAVLFVRYELAGMHATLPARVVDIPFPVSTMM